MIWWVAQNLIFTALLAGAVWLVCQLTRIGPAARHALWLVVLVKLAAPPIVVWPWEPDDVLNLVSFAADSLSASSETEAAIRAIAPGPPAPGLQPSGARVVIVTEFAAPAEDPVVEYVPAAEHVPVPEWAADSGPAHPGPTFAASPFIRQMALGQRRILRVLAAIWAIGAAMTAFVQFVRMLRVSAWLRGAGQAPPWLCGEVERFAAALKIRPPDVVLAKRAGSPFVCSLGRSVLVWPARFAEAKEAESWRGVIVHELAHLRRRDHWVGWLELIVGCVWWWNPLAWYVRSQLRENAELACDAWVAATLPDGRRAYAEALLKVCQCFSQPAEPMLALSVGAVSRRAFERRLTMLFCGSRSYRLTPSSLLAIGLLGLITIPGWSQTSSDTVAAPAEAPVVETQVAPVVAGETTADPQVAEIPADTGKAQGELSSETPSADAGGVAAENTPAATTRDQQLSELEARLQELSSQIQALRGAQSPSATSQLQPWHKGEPLQNSFAPYRTEVVNTPVYEFEHRKSEDGKTEVVAVPRMVQQTQIVRSASDDASPYGRTLAAAQLAAAAQQTDGEGQGADGDLVEMLSRKRYQLPKVKAEALLAFLESHIDAPVEAVVKDDAIIVTASLENQAVIGDFINVMQNLPAKRVAAPRSSIIGSRQGQPGSAASYGSGVQSPYHPPARVAR